MNGKQKIFALILISSFTLLFITMYGLGWDGNYLKKNELYDSQLKDHVKKSVKEIRGMWTGKNLMYRAIKNIYDVGSFDMYSEKIIEADKRKIIYDQLIKDGYIHLEDFGSFSSKLLSEDASENPIIFNLNYLKSNDFDIYMLFKEENKSSDIVIKMENAEPKEYYSAFKFSKILNKKYAGINWLGIISIIGIVTSFTGFYLFKD